MSKQVSVADFFKRKRAVKKEEIVSSQEIVIDSNSEDEKPKKIPRPAPIPKTASPVKPVKASPPVTTVLSGSTVTFTGEMSVDRDSATLLAQKAGARVTSAVSSKTTYLVIGSVLEDGRPIEEGSKYKKATQLAADKKPGPKIMTEDEFMKIVKPGGGGDVSKPIDIPTPAIAHASNSIWVDKYEPTRLTEFVGNKANVSKFISWLENWKKNGVPKGGSTRPGFRGANMDARAVLISGPPGVGKSLLAKLGCESLGMTIVEFNASDYRNKAAVELIGETVANSSSISWTTGKLEKMHALIMDECDGMSAGDRGGNQALIQVIKKTKIPIICICNDRMDPKVRSLANYCLDLKFVRPSKPEVVTRCEQILRGENQRPPAGLIEQIVESAECDIRQSVNQLQLASFNWNATIRAFERKDKSTMLTAFDAARAIFSTATFNDKLDWFFVDYDLIPLLMQQNYPKFYGPKQMNEMVRSADLISRGDVISRSIRGDQNWSLLPLFGMIGTVFVPPKVVEGAPYPEFPVWLGKYSHTRKIARIAQELTCVVATGSTVTSRNIITSNYPNVLYRLLVKELVHAGQTGHDSDLTILSTLGVHKNDLMEILTELLLPWQENLFDAQVDPKMKAAITRICNNHHMALKTGGAHFRHTGKSAASLSIKQNIDDIKQEEIDDEEDEEATVKAKKEVDTLVKAAAPAKRSSKRKAIKK
jgi:replication factor C subunit 1